MCITCSAVPPQRCTKWWKRMWVSATTPMHAHKPQSVTDLLAFSINVFLPGIEDKQCMPCFFIDNGKRLHVSPSDSDICHLSKRLHIKIHYHAYYTTASGLLELRVLCLWGSGWENHMSQVPVHCSCKIICHIHSIALKAAHSTSCLVIEKEDSCITVTTNFLRYFEMK